MSHPPSNELCQFFNMALRPIYVPPSAVSSMQHQRLRKKSVNRNISEKTAPQHTAMASKRLNGGGFAPAYSLPNADLTCEMEVMLNTNTPGDKVSCGLKNCTWRQNGQHRPGPDSKSRADSRLRGRFLVLNRSGSHRVRLVAMVHGWSLQSKTTTAWDLPSPCKKPTI